MLDLLFVLLGLGFFVIAILYVYGCDWFIREDKTQSDKDRVATNRDQEQFAG
jgi:hypothetical protein